MRADGQHGQRMRIVSAMRSAKMRWNEFARLALRFCVSDLTVIAVAALLTPHTAGPTH